MKSKRWCTLCVSSVFRFKTNRNLCQKRVLRSRLKKPKNSTKIYICCILLAKRFSCPLILIRIEEFWKKLSHLRKMWLTSVMPTLVIMICKGYILSALLNCVVNNGFRCETLLKEQVESKSLFAKLDIDQHWIWNRLIFLCSEFKRL